MADFTKGWKIKTFPSESTKVCNHCGMEISKGLLVVRMGDYHQQHDGSFYSSNSVYVHTSCVKEWCSEMLEEIEDRKEEIKQNYNKIIAKSL